MKTDNTFESLLLNKRKGLLGHAFKLTGNSDDAEDLLQEVSLKVLEHRNQFKDGTNFYGWAHKIMDNLFVNMCRMKKTREFYVELSDSVFYRVDTGIDAGITETGYDLKEILRAVDALPKTYRRTFQLFISGFKYEEIADKQGIPVGTVKTRIFYARKALQIKLKDFNR